MEAEKSKKILKILSIINIIIASTIIIFSIIRLANERLTSLNVDVWTFYWMLINLNSTNCLYKIDFSPLFY